MEKLANLRISIEYPVKMIDSKIIPTKDIKDEKVKEIEKI